MIGSSPASDHAPRIQQALQDDPLWQARPAGITAPGVDWVVAGKAEGHYPRAEGIFMNSIVDSDLKKAPTGQRYGSFLSASTICSLVGLFR